MRRLAVLLALLVGFVIPPRAEARLAQPFAYRYEQVWSATVRLLRVDLRLPISDRDSEIGFILFDWIEGRRATPGSVELLRTEVDGHEQIRVTVQIAAMPTYVERMLLDRLQRKLLEDYGEPLRPPTRRTTSRQPVSGDRPVEAGASGGESSAPRNETAR
ncbi:MAG: hypothetical protein NZ898_02495 [Myxococcota bacterium]|nr:hypothetical protein [Myxococcota bacterium]MDW8362628.1 hypothetical protein [Myxococcales bacterium]